MYSKPALNPPSDAADARVDGGNVTSLKDTGRPPDWLLRDVYEEQHPESRVTVYLYASQRVKQQPSTVEKSFY